MAVVYLSGVEAGEVGLDGIALGGTAPAVYSTAQARTGSRSIRCAVAVGVSGTSFITIPATAGWLHFGLYITTLPSAAGPRDIVLLNAGLSLNLLNAGTLTFGSASGAGTTVLALNTWYWIGVRRAIGAFTGVWVTLNGVPEITKSATPTGVGTSIGFLASTATGGDIYVDDIIIDDTGFISPSNVTDLRPTADSAVGTGWTLGSGGTTNLWGGVDNQPPTAVADAGTTAQIRNAASAANSNYDATLQTYTVGGAASGATVLAVQPIVATGSPVVTSAKLGTVGNVSNPAITNVALGAGGTAGAFWSGVAAGTYPTGWKVSQGTLTTSPSVTLGTAPVMRVTQSTASTRIAMVGYMALRVAWTPGAPPVTGSGAGSGTAGTASGTAAETFVGTGGGTGTAASATGGGDVTAAATTGTGAGTQAAAAALGTGVETISESGAGSPPPAMSAGTGSSLLAVTGTGAGEQAAASATGEALQVFPGGGVQVPQSAYGEGTVEGGVEVPPTVEGSTIFAPKLRVIAGGGGGVQVSQSAKGRGRVNDDDLVVMAA